MANELVPLVIYHGNCADGFSAAWVFHHLSVFDPHKQFEFHAGVYNDPLPDGIDGRKVYLVDFSYFGKQMEELLRRARRVILIDHHKTAIDRLDDYLLYDNFAAYTDLERSGAMLAWDYWFNAVIQNGKGNVIAEIKKEEPRYHHPPRLLDHIQDRDLWTFKLPDTRNINAGVFSYEYTFENWDRMMLGGITELLDLNRGGAAIERKHHKDVAELVRICQRIVRIGNYEIPVASLPYTLASDGGHMMANEYKNGTMFAACYYDTATHRVFSLRSTERGMDVSAVATEYEGGGHKHAAGFRVPRTHVLAMI